MSWVQLLLFVGVLLALVRPLGLFMAGMFEGQPSWLTRLLGPLERGIYRAAGIDPQQETGWRDYAAAALAVNMLGLVVVYSLQRLQGLLPLNPQQFSAVSADSAFNTAVSFITNTNWQGYGGENTMSYLTQMLGLAVQNFLSAATGIAVLVAVIRGFVRHETRLLGNFWVDFVRSTVY
ncbi:MAG TPA: potassium-transporting ATPase subunit KdpA, partial [Steroidobacteraceae bacterium]|nr:potassium-transporting ATPase subunit KdpA [Steroidobacteraceae bacterium]